MSRSLIERLAELTDPRCRRGRQYPMVRLLTLCLVAILAGHNGPEAIAQFGRLRQKRLGHALGFKNGTSAHVAKVMNSNSTSSRPLSNRSGETASGL